MIREIVGWFMANGYELTVNNGKLKYRFVHGERPEQDILDEMFEKLQENKPAVIAYLEKLPAWRAAYRAWATAWDTLKADQTHANAVVLAEAAIRIGLPCYDAEGVDRRSAGWRAWAAEWVIAPEPEKEIAF